MPTDPAGILTDPGGVLHVGLRDVIPHGLLNPGHIPGQEDP